MSTPLMTHAQQSTFDSQASWDVPRGAALRLSIGPGVRCLHLLEGRLWLTPDGTAEKPGVDVWLNAGDELTLVSGSEWVVEAWSHARFQLLVPPQACTHGSFGRGVRQIGAAARRLGARYLPGPASNMLA